MRAKHKRALGLVTLVGLIGAGAVYALAHRTVTADVVNGITTTDVLTKQSFDAGTYADTALSEQGQLQLKVGE